MKVCNEKLKGALLKVSRHLDDHPEEKVQAYLICVELENGFRMEGEWHYGVALQIMDYANELRAKNV